MGSSLRDLNSRQLERLKSELAEVIITNFCYPSFLDYRLNILRTRPIDRRKRREVWAYVNSIQMNPLGSMEASSMEFRRFVERVFLRYIEMNRGLIEGTSQRQFAAMRARVPQLAMQVARSLIDYLALGEASSFGRARPVESWGAQTQSGSEPTWEQIEKSTQLLQTTLVYLRTSRETGPTPALTNSGSLRPVSADISNFPTRLLTPPASAPLAPAGGTNGVAGGSGAYPALGNGATQGMGNGSASFQPPQPEEPGGQRQFLGPTRSRTASRPIDGSLSLPSLSPRTVPTEPTAPPPSAPPSQPAASQPARVPSQPLPDPLPAPSSKQPEPAEQSLPPSDAWQALLWPGANQQTKEGADAASAPPAPKLEEQSAPTEADLLELPESFEVPPVLDLPPDLAELYGDYLRDARAGVLEASSDESDTPASDELPQSPPGSPTLALEPDEELDSLFDALASHIAAEDASAPISAHEEHTELGTPAGAAPFGSERLAPSNPLPAPQARDTVGSQTQEQPAHQLPSTDRPASAPLGRQSPPEASSAESRERPASGALMGPPASGKLVEGDVMIFAQLQHQVTTWVKMAAVSHQIEITGRDALELVAELRRMAALDEAELQVIESLVSLCQRVTTSKQAAMDDYKQAMMLYLLHHRSRLAL